jgi:hypothetical protein
MGPGTARSPAQPADLVVSMDRWRLLAAAAAWANRRPHRKNLRRPPRSRPAISALDLPIIQVLMIIPMRRDRDDARRPPRTGDIDDRADRRAARGARGRRLRRRARPGHARARALPVPPGASGGPTMPGAMTLIEPAPARDGRRRQAAWDLAASLAPASGPQPPRPGRDDEARPSGCSACKNSPATIASNDRAAGLASGEPRPIVVVTPGPPSNDLRHSVDTRHSPSTLRANARASEGDVFATALAPCSVRSRRGRAGVQVRSESRLKVATTRGRCERRSATGSRATCARQTATKLWPRLAPLFGRVRSHRAPRRAPSRPACRAQTRVPAALLCGEASLRCRRSCASGTAEAASCGSAPGRSSRLLPPNPEAVARAGNALENAPTEALAPPRARPKRASTTHSKCNKNQTLVHIARSSPIQLGSRPDLHPAPAPASCAKIRTDAFPPSRGPRVVEGRSSTRCPK